MTPKVVASRTLPRGLAPIVEQLEMEQDRLITSRDLEQIRLRTGIATPTNVLAARLRQRGWLLETSRRGVYEFAPGSHAGALSSGQVTLPLQAVLRARPELIAGLALQSAAWAFSLADRAPSRLEVAVADRSAVAGVARLLRNEARVLAFSPQLPWEHRRGVPVMVAESVLVHMASRPRDVRSWSSALEWLPDLAAELDLGRLQIELDGRAAAAATRAAYLLSGLRPDLAGFIPTHGHGKVYFGPRAPLRRHDAALQVADTVLPFDPRTLEPVAP